MSFFHNSELNSAFHLTSPDFSSPATAAYLSLFYVASRAAPAWVASQKCHCGATRQVIVRRTPSEIPLRETVHQTPGQIQNGSDAPASSCPCVKTRPSKLAYHTPHAHQPGCESHRQQPLDPHWQQAGRGVPQTHFNILSKWTTFVHTASACQQNPRHRLLVGTDVSAAKRDWRTYPHNCSGHLAWYDFGAKLAPPHSRRRPSIRAR